jgi:class 3 adenylate cyclase/alpha-beta hydrolase superfamily lysophospholipase
MQSPEIRYALSGDVSIAYIVSGDHPLDLVFVHGSVGNLEYSHRQPERAAFFERLAQFARVIEFDRRGTGLSDRVREIPSLETRMDDLRAVMDSAGSERAALVGTFEAAAMAALFAATYPERVGALVMYNPIVRGTWASDYPFGQTEAELTRELDDLRRTWGTPEFFDEWLREVAPTHADDPEFRSWFASTMRTGASPGSAVSIARMAMNVDIRDILTSIRVPTLVLCRPFKRDEARHITERIPGARSIEIGGPDTMFFLAEGLRDEIERFVTSVWTRQEPDTVLATVLFTDIVGSTAKAAEVGDRAWAELVQRHHALVRSQLDRFRGRELDTAGDGFLAAFDGPIRAIRCARTIGTSVQDLGLEIRAGLHTGECEVVGEKLGGIAVNIGARVASRAQPGEVLVTSTVKDLVAGSGLAFDDRGVAELKGVPGEWRLYAVAEAAS